LDIQREGTAGMKPSRNPGLLAKINLIIAVILLSFFTLFTFLNYRQQSANTLDEAVEKARIIAAAAIQTREYLSREYLQGKVVLSEERYSLIPVVASNRIGVLVGEDIDYRIRQVSDRYRNPKNAPDPFEKQMLDKFHADPRLVETYAITDLEGERVFRYLHSFTAEQSCLECHGDPEAAPDYIKRLFPEEIDQAYHYRIGEVIGAASVTIPMERLQRQIMANVRNGLYYSGGIFLALITCLGLLIRMTVTRPLGQLGAAVQEIIRSDRFEKIPRRSRDEIGTLIAGFNEMIGHLREKTEHLEESESRFRLLTETARDGIVSFLANGQIILFNRQAERIFGYGKLDVLGEKIDQLIHPDCVSLQAKGAEQYLREEGERLLRSKVRIVGRKRNGTPVPLELTLSVADSEGHLFYTAILRESD
jgi:PAS domain S-box-containing protein